MTNGTMLEARLAERNTLLERAITLLKSDERIVAAWLFGSLGNGTADSLSDIDLWVVVSDEHIGEISKARQEYVAKLGSPLLIQEAPQNAPAGGAYLLALYSGEAGPHQVDWYWQPQSAATIPPDTRLLFDRMGLPHAESAPPLSSEERTERASNQVAFFWAMCIVAAKKIARRQPWGALTMFGMLTYTLEEVEWLVGLRDERPGYKDTRTDAPPVQPADQMAMLREMAGRMEELTPQIEAISVSVPRDAIAQIYRFFDIAQAR